MSRGALSLVTYNERNLPRKITASSGGDTIFAQDASGTRVESRGRARRS